MNDARNEHDVQRHQRPRDERFDAAVAALQATEPILSADRITFHREMLMNQIMTLRDATAQDQAIAPSELTRRRRRRLIIAGASALVVGGLVASPAAAGLVNGFIHRAPQSAEEADRMEVLYKGQSYTWAQIYAMQKEGKAVMTLEEPSTYNKGQALAFDTEAEQNEWVCTHLASKAKLPMCQNVSPSAVPTASS